MAGGDARRGRRDPHRRTASAEQSWTEAVLEVLDERVRIVSVPNVHWTDGALVDLDDRERAHARRSARTS